jgi:hypothetical protein
MQWAVSSPELLRSAVPTFFELPPDYGQISTLVLSIMVTPASGITPHIENLYMQRVICLTFVNGALLARSVFRVLLVELGMLVLLVYIYICIQHKSANCLKTLYLIPNNRQLFHNPNTSFRKQLQLCSND